MTRKREARGAELRVVSWNVENVAPLLARGATPSLAEIAQRLGAPDVLCLQEVRVRAHDEALVEAMERAIPDHECHSSLNSDKMNAAHRGGRAYGVATWVKRGLRPLPARTFAWDREGRAVVTELGEHALAIVNVYAVNGTNKPHFDHDLGRVAGDRHAWKRRFVELLAKECAKLRARGLELVLIGDFNVSRTKMDTEPRLRTEAPHARARKEFNESFMPSLDVVDALRELHPTERKYTWFSRRSRPEKLDAARVDFALVSRTLLPRVVAADVYDEEMHRHQSDHVPIGITLRI